MNNVEELDRIALQYESGIIGVASEQFKQIEYLYQRCDVLDLVPAILSTSNSTTVQLAAVRALSYIVESESINENSEFIRCLLISFLPKYKNNKNIYKQLTKVLSSLASKQFPEEWPDFLEFIMSCEPPNFLALSEFLQDIKDKYDSPAHSKTSINIIKDNIVTILNHIIEYFPSNYSIKALESIAGMTTWKVLSEAHIERIFDKECKKSFSIYSELCLVDEIPSGVLNMLFSKLLDNIGYDNICQIEDIVKFRFDMLNTDDVVKFYQIILSDETSFDSHIDLYELVILLIYKNHMDGNQQLLEKIKGIIVSIRKLIIRNFTNPPDLIYGETDISTRDEMNYILFKQMKRILTCVLDLDPESFYSEITEFIGEEGEDPEAYCNIINVVAQLNDAPSEIISSVLELSFAHWQNPESSLLVRVSFLYLCSKLIQKDLIDASYVEDISTAALEYLGDRKQGKAASSLLLQISQKCPEALLADFTPNILFSLNLRNDIFSEAAESLINVLNAADNAELMVQEISQKWNSVLQEGITLNSLDNLIKVLCALKGIASAGVEGVQELVGAILPQLDELTDEIALYICRFYEENPYGALQRYDVRSMLSVIKLQIQLYIESNVLTSFHILELLSEFPKEIRIDEAFDLCLYVLALNPSEENVNSIRETILGPFEEDFISNGNENLSQQNMCMKMIYVIAKASPELIKADDLQYVIANIVRRWTTVSEFSIETASKIFKRAKDNHELMQQFIPDIISALIIKLAEVSNLGHIEQIIGFIHSINISGISFSENILYITESIVNRFPFMDENEVFETLTEVFGITDISIISSKIQFLASKLEQIPLYQVEKHIFITTLQRTISSHFELS